jgi:hypothetical protein
MIGAEVMHRPARPVPTYTRLRFWPFFIGAGLILLGLQLWVGEFRRCRPPADREPELARELRHPR